LAADLAANMYSGGSSAMSNRELDIMRLMAQGMGLSDIAASLAVSYKTVANACTVLKQKLMVERTADLIRLAVEMHADQRR
jgi:two-component system, NarL family, invasion response regulator UvrY